MTTTDEYPVTYSVLADGRYEALGKAASMLRTNVRTVGETVAEQGCPGWWDVTFRVVEDIGADDPVWPGDLPDHAPDATYEMPEGLDPITAAKGELARWGA